uniref:Putative pogo transposable element n=1 Tax=Ixodes ricinus TaxID=34613 RepID=A0A6B0UGV9_IXORI
MHSYTVAKKIEVVQWHRENGKNAHQTSRQIKLDRIREWDKNFDNLLQPNYGKAKLRRKLSNGAPVSSEYADDAIFEYLQCAKKVQCEPLPTGFFLKRLSK